MTKYGGNPNLLYSPSKEQCYVIDHNLAFDFEYHGFWDTHIFRDDLLYWDIAFQQEMTVKFEQGLQLLEAIWNTLPDDWTDDQSLDTLTLPALKTSLSRFRDPAFWRPQ